MPQKDENINHSLYFPLYSYREMPLFAIVEVRNAISGISNKARKAPELKR